MTEMNGNYLIRGARILSLSDGGTREADIRVRNGIAQEIRGGLLPEREEMVLDASGCFLTSGWIDAHVHAGDPGGPEAGEGIGLPIDTELLPKGTTCLLDAGSAGCRNYEAYRKLYGKGTARCLAWLNLGRYGINRGRMDFAGPEDIREEEIRNVFEKDRDRLLGLKIRIDPHTCFDPPAILERARKLADELSARLQGNAPRSDLGIGAVLGYLKPGDMLTHCYADCRPGMRITEEDGGLKTCVAEARERGVLFDIGHGSSVFSARVARDAWDCGFLADTFSTDLHQGVSRPECACDMAGLLSKMKAITGLAWHVLLGKCILDPVKLLGISGKDTAPLEKRPADFTLFRIEKGSFAFPESDGGVLNCEERLRVVSVCAGELLLTPGISCKERDMS